MSAVVRKERMQWVDAMRGFSMILVVFGHLQICMGLNMDDSILCMVLSTFRMPLFFFVSGYFSFRAIEWWDRRRVGDMVKRKIQAQIIGTVVFSAVLQIILNGVGSVSYENGFGGYWFTIVLFQMYMIYLFLSLVSRLIKRNIVIPSLIVVSVLFVGVLTKWHTATRLWTVLCWTNLTLYMQFFTLGIICSKYRDKFFAILKNNTFITVTIVCWLVCLILVNDAGFRESVPFAVFYLSRYVVVRYFGLAVVVVMFFAAKERFENDTVSSRWLKYVGRRTLDIYFIHYFLLPNLKFMAPWFEDNTRLVLQLLWGIPVTVAIVAVCLLVSFMLRRSTTLAAWLFGVRLVPTAGR